MHQRRDCCPGCFRGGAVLMLTLLWYGAAGDPPPANPPVPKTPERKDPDKPDEDETPDVPGTEPPPVPILDPLPIDTPRGPLIAGPFRCW